MTIVAGILLTPFFAVDPLHKKLPMKELVMSGIILFGVVLMQVEHASSLGIRETVLCVVPVLIAAFAYPLDILACHSCASLAASFSDQDPEVRYNLIVLPSFFFIFRRHR